MLLICRTCGAAFNDRQSILGRERHLHGRLQCLGCRPFRPRRSPSFATHRPPRVLTCQSCGAAFPSKVAIDGKVRSLYSRRFCLDCSPFGAHNTSKVPPGALSASALEAYRRRRRSAKFYRYQKKRRRSVKARLIAELGGRCSDCGYPAHPNALEFHHLDASRKAFTMSRLIGTLSYEALAEEAQKCVLVCANCHRARHAAAVTPAEDADPRLDARRELKTRAVVFMGGSCAGCGRSGPSALFEFHHRDASAKEFGIGEDGRVRTWRKIQAELAKCVMLCANCHREVHAGARTLDGRLVGLAEHAIRYAA